MAFLKRFLKNESGATAIEYTLIVALIAIATVVAVKQTGAGIRDNLNAIFEETE